jgi:hypothetical protein
VKHLLYCSLQFLEEAEWCHRTTHAFPPSSSVLLRGWVAPILEGPMPAGSARSQPSRLADSPTKNEFLENAHTGVRNNVNKGDSVVMISPGGQHVFTVPQGADGKDKKFRVALSKARSADGANWPFSYGCAR